MVERIVLGWDPLMLEEGRDTWTSVCILSRISSSGQVLMAGGRGRTVVVRTSQVGDKRYY